MKGKRLYVGNLNYSINRQELGELFSEYGKVDFVRIIKNKGFGFVQMNNINSANLAIEDLNGIVFHGRKIKVAEAKRKKIIPKLIVKEYS
ncbi:MAG: RNA-binding protein [Candidatus Dadabacteria bacterium]|nr:RNA-binding protein [Candidatus Dadabacteria bacterium]